MAISLGNSEKKGFSDLLFQIWEYTKQLQIMKNQKGNHTLTLFFSQGYFISESETIQNTWCCIFKVVDISECIWKRQCALLLFFFFPHYHSDCEIVGS